MSLLDKIIKPVYAHCDLPCGIYETDTMRHAADSCLRMVEKISELGDLDSLEHHNSLVRAVQIKEQQAQLCKDQLYLLWSDYFKPEHLQKFPDLHDKIWQAAKQCSRVKQSVDLAECQCLQAMIADVKSIFEASKL